MSESVAEEPDMIEIKEMTIDQLAGAAVLFLGAIGSLLLVIWQSRCECDMNCCYIIRCHRKPPPDPEKADDKKEADPEEGAEEDEEETPSLTPNSMN